MSKTYSAETIVLKRTNLNEADRLVTFLSKYKGKFTAIAKGVRKIASRRSPNLELFNHVKVHMASGKSFDVVTEAETTHTFKSIKSDLKKTSAGYYLLEICNGFLEVGQGGREIFDLLLKTLQMLDEEDPSINKILRAFEMKFLEKIGFKPSLRVCQKCDKDLQVEKIIFSPDLGSVLHEGCLSESLFSKPLSHNSLKVLRFFQDEDWQKIKRLNIPRPLEEELESFSRLYLEYLLEKELKSGQFLSDLESFPQEEPRFAN